MMRVMPQMKLRYNTTNVDHYRKVKFLQQQKDEYSKIEYSLLLYRGAISLSYANSP